MRSGGGYGPGAAPAFRAGALILVAGMALWAPPAAGLPEPGPGRSETGAPRLSLALAEYMRTAPDSEFIPVVVMLKRQLSVEEKVAAFDTIPGTTTGVDLKRERRKILIPALMRLSQATQHRLLDSLGQWAPRNRVQRIRPLWLIDAVGVRARKPVILEMLGFDEAAFIDLDLPRPALATGTPTWGVSRVHADQVWNGTPTGYTGHGVVVGILDSGISYGHRDLQKRLWINTSEDNGDGVFKSNDSNGIDADPLPGPTGVLPWPTACDPPPATGGTLPVITGAEYVDDVIGWDFANNRNSPDDDMGHGTWMAGVVAGDGTGGTATGVAPGASLMVLRCTESATGLTDQVSAWTGMQYALAKGADIVNASLAFETYWTEDYDGWRLAVENLSDGGVLFVTGSGNRNHTNPDPYNVWVPGRVPSALTLGATNDADARWVNPADPNEGSSYGPVTWQDSALPNCAGSNCASAYSDYPYEPGLPKPDVMAPGDAIVTTALGASGYTTPPSGTSFAAAHASGVAALQLEKDPGLTPPEIRFILQETATDLGAAGRDEENGWGLIDAKAAVDYTLDKTPYDLAVTGTNALWTTEDIWVDNDHDGKEDIPSLSTVNSLYARIRNLGGEALANVEVKFFYADVATIGIGGFDPNGDGDPCDGVFNYIGSYRIPIIGPAGSRQNTGVAVVNWSVPNPGTSHWCVGIGIVGGNASNHAEANLSNNVAFRNFFEVEASTAVFPFRIAPAPRTPGRPFDLEILRRNLPATVTLELWVPKAVARGLQSPPQGFDRITAPRPGRVGAAWKRYLESRERERTEARYRVRGDRAVMRGIVSRGGKFLPARLVIHSSKKLPPAEDRYVIVNTLDSSGRPVGGLTLKIVDRK